MQTLGYNPKDSKSIYEYSKKLINKTLRDFIIDDNLKIDSKNKGDLGNLVEKYFFKLKTNNKSEADFKEAGLELKTTGVKKLSKGGYAPKERLVLAKIDYHEVVKNEFHESHFLDKIKLMLLLFYIYEKDKSSIDQVFIKNKLWNMSSTDLSIMKNDWETIIQKIKEGRAHELSESDTLYLSACTKGATSLDRTTQPFSDVKAKPRAFSFKQSYLKVIFNSDDSEEYGTLLNDSSSLDLYQFVSLKLNKYIGRTFNSLYVEFGNGLNIGTKNIRSLIIYRMLGTTKSRIEEFDKAGIITKVIKLERSDTLKESISFPYFKYKEIAEQSWEESDLYSIIESQFLFLIFQKSNRGEIFKGYKFWSMPYSDRIEVEALWNDTINKIKNNSIDFLGIKDTRIAHVRPHGRDKKDTNPLPNGTMVVKKSFWLNAKYIANQLQKSN